MRIYVAVAIAAAALAVIGCGGGGGAPSADICETCTFSRESADVCLADCDETWGDLRDLRDGCRSQCRLPCGRGLYCTLFVGGTSGLRCAIDDPAVSTCCVGNRSVECP